MVNDAEAVSRAIGRTMALDMQRVLDSFILNSIDVNPLRGTFDRFFRKHFPNGVADYPSVTLAQFERMIQDEPIEIAGLFDANGELYATFSDDSASSCSIPFPARPCHTFTHTHPRSADYGTAPLTLSFADIYAGIKIGASEVRAVAPEGVYAATLRPRGGDSEFVSVLLHCDWITSPHCVPHDCGDKALIGNSVHQFWQDIAGGPIVASYAFVPRES